MVVHNKPNSNDLEDKISKIIIVEGMEKQMYRKFLLRWGFQKLVVGGALEFDSREPNFGCQRPDERQSLLP